MRGSKLSTPRSTIAFTFPPQQFAMRRFQTTYMCSFSRFFLTHATDRLTFALLAGYIAYALSLTPMHTQMLCLQPKDNISRPTLIPIRAIYTSNRNRLGLQHP